MANVAWSAVSRIPLVDTATWPLRRGISNFLTLTKFRNEPAVIPVPTDAGPPVTAVPIAAKFPDLPIDGLVVADHVPADETRLKNLAFSSLQRHVYQLLPPVKAGAPAVPDDPNEALGRAYTPAHRRCFRFPDRPPEYDEGVDLGRLAVASPYACYLEQTDDPELFRWDLRSLADFDVDCHPGLIAPGARVDFRLDSPGRRLDAVAIDSALGLSRPDDPDWPAATRLALCTATTHLSLVRHFNWIHLVAGARWAMVTRNELPADHRLRRLLWPHVYGTQYGNKLVTPGLMRRGGDFENIFSYTHNGVCRLFQATVDNFDIQLIDPFGDAFRRGVAGAGFDTPALDNRLDLMAVIRNHATRYLDLYYPDDGAVADDESLQRWLEALDRALPHGVRHVSGGGRTPVGLAALVSTLIYLVTVEHEIVGSGLWDYQLWTDVHPVRVYRDGSRPPVDVYQRLVNADITLNVDRTSLMSDFSHLALDPRGADAFGRFVADLRALQADLAGRPGSCWRIEPKVLKANINA